jgi:hypothetical protein
VSQLRRVINHIRSTLSVPVRSACHLSERAALDGHHLAWSTSSDPICSTADASSDFGFSLPTPSNKYYFLRQTHGTSVIARTTGYHSGGNGDTRQPTGHARAASILFRATCRLFKPTSLDFSSPSRSLLLSTSSSPTDRMTST